MSLPLLHSAADLLQALLIDGTVGSDPALWLAGTEGTAWPVFVNGEPDRPDNCITVYDTSDQFDGRSMLDGESWWHRGVQVRIRGATEPVGKAKALTVQHFLEGLYSNQLTVSTSAGTATYAVACVAGNQLLKLGTEAGKSKRWLWTINGKMPMYRVS